MVAVRGNIAAGYALSDRIAALQAEAERIGILQALKRESLTRT